MKRSLTFFMLVCISSAVGAEQRYTAEVEVINNTGMPILVVDKLHGQLLGSGGSLGSNGKIDTLVLYPDSGQDVEKFYMAYINGVPLCVLKTLFLHDDTVAVHVESLGIEDVKNSPQLKYALNEMYKIMVFDVQDRSRMSSSAWEQSVKLRENFFQRLRHDKRSILVDKYVKRHGAWSDGTVTLTTGTWTSSPITVKVTAMASKDLTGNHQSRCKFTFSKAK